MNPKNKDVYTTINNALLSFKDLPKSHLDPEQTDLQNFINWLYEPAIATWMRPGAWCYLKEDPAKTPMLLKEVSPTGATTYQDSIITPAGFESCIRVTIRPWDLFQLNERLMYHKLTLTNIKTGRSFGEMQSITRTKDGTIYVYTIHGPVSAERLAAEFMTQNLEPCGNPIEA